MNAKCWNGTWRINREERGEVVRRTRDTGQMIAARSTLAFTLASPMKHIEARLSVRPHRAFGNFTIGGLEETASEPSRAGVCFPVPGRRRGHALGCPLSVRNGRPGPGAPWQNRVDFNPCEHPLGGVASWVSWPMAMRANSRRSSRNRCGNNRCARPAKADRDPRRPPAAASPVCGSRSTPGSGGRGIRMAKVGCDKPDANVTDKR